MVLINIFINRFIVYGFRKVGDGILEREFFDVIGKGVRVTFVVKYSTEDATQIKCR